LDLVGEAPRAKEQELIIEVAYCERCGHDSPWRVARQANRGLPGCPVCGSARVSLSEREETPAEVEPILEGLAEKM
jgi:predicted Zn-ribbon and HTH transcriptional regulator